MFYRHKLYLFASAAAFSNGPVLRIFSLFRRQLCVRAGMVDHWPAPPHLCTKNALERNHGTGPSNRFQGIPPKVPAIRAVSNPSIGSRWVGHSSDPPSHPPYAESGAWIYMHISKAGAASE